MQRLIRSFSGKAPATVSTTNIADEGPVRPTVASSEAHTSIVKDSYALISTGTEPEARASNADQSLFNGVVSKFKAWNFGSSTSTARVTPDEHGSSSDTNVVTKSTGEEPSINHSTQTHREPAHIASTIQSLLKSLSLPSPVTPKSPTRDANELPTPPRRSAPIDDAQLIAMLQNATVMNGDESTLSRDVAERRQSVWSALDSLGEEYETDSEAGMVGAHSPAVVDMGEASGVMMYSPLMPTNLSLVEIAESGIIEPDQREEQIVDPTSETAQVAGWMGMWPFSTWNSVSGSGLPSNIEPVATPSSPVSLPSSPRSRSAHLRSQAKKRVWIPSTNELSFQAVWWGYRIYLPPPVMDTLGDRSMEAAKRAAVITTALTWFFHNIPLVALPVALRPAVLLLQTLIPYIGYLGSFISWSWGTIQSYDTGNGVILTATWLLPVALIPSTWEADTFPPPSPPSPSSQPLPPIASPTSAPLLQVSSTAALPTPPDTPPSAPTPHADTPIHLPVGVQSPALSFVTAPSSPLQSPPQSWSPALYPAPFLPFAMSMSVQSTSPQMPDTNLLSPISLAPPYSSSLMVPQASPYSSPPPPHPNPLSPISLSSPYSSPPMIPPASPSPLFHHASPYPSPQMLPHASEPLPSWVHPPPPPNPSTIPLPDLELEHEHEMPTPRFGVPRLLPKRRSRSRMKSKSKSKTVKAEGVAFGDGDRDRGGVAEGEGSGVSGIENGHGGGSTGGSGHGETKSRSKSKSNSFRKDGDQSGKRDAKERNGNRKMKLSTIAGAFTSRTSKDSVTG